MSANQITLLLILTLLCALSLQPQDTSIEVFVHDHYTEKPLESALVSVLRHGVVIDSVYTDVYGKADIFITATSVRDRSGIPSTISLSHNFPTPFNDETKVELAVPEAQTIRATIYNVLGQSVATDQIPVSAGYYTLNLSLAHLPTGVYFLRVEGRESQAIKLLKMGRGIQTSGPMFSISLGSSRESIPVSKAIDDGFILRVEKGKYTSRNRFLTGRLYNIQFSK